MVLADVQIHGIIRAMSDDFSQCLVTNVRMAARAVTRRYDGYMRPRGLTSTQFALLVALRPALGRSVTNLAESMGFERTTLTRNLARLEEQGLVEARRSEGGNGRSHDLTAKGRATVREVLPLWRKAQADMRAELGADEFADVVAVLRRLGTS